jgi:hypothetical protein
LNMAQKPSKEFGTRKPVVVQPAAPVKRSRHVALLLTGTLAIGGGAYALTPGENCAPNQPGMAASASAGCSARGSSSSGGHGSSGGSSRSNFFSGDSSSGGSKGVSSSDAGSGSVTRGGFGSFAHAFTSHFSGGG